jgi:hypothetical protein
MFEALTRKIPQKIVKQAAENKSNTEIIKAAKIH